MDFEQIFISYKIGNNVCKNIFLYAGINRCVLRRPDKRIIFKLATQRHVVVVFLLQRRSLTRYRYY